MDSNDTPASIAAQHQLAPGASDLDATEAEPTNKDAALLAALRTGDETAFVMLVQRYNASLHRLALNYVRNPAIAQEVVQDTWMGVLKGIDSFESRATLKTWIFRILINRAKTSAAREGRHIPFSEAWDAANEAEEAVVDPDRFVSAESGDRRYGWWSEPPSVWGGSPEEAALTAETRAYLERAIAALPDSQREVITLRDIEGLPSADVCNLLRLTEINQRVLLHRARSRVRQALESYFAQER